MLHAQQRAENVGIKDRRIAFGSLFRYRTRSAFGAGVINGHIQATKTCDGLVNQTSYFGFVTHIGAHEFGFSPEFAKLSDELLTFLFASARTHFRLDLPLPAELQRR